ncbi:hypothetical protein [Acidisoma silvae]|uniref:Uncharacterized protein n=1 Tax=Acidisoma silvae TaxID=2802396 RepID=A0A963YSZ2_9PROT|nr:hypothetical protein [Acidisoma silvae]MCB8876371.1 hypothetical protein [Acidisoma silvae]
MQKAKPSGSEDSIITISRDVRAGLVGTGFAFLGIALASLVGLAGCAAPAPRVVSVSPGSAATDRLPATVLAIRPVPPAAPQGEGAILAAMGSTGSAPVDQAEVILRTAQGGIVSVVQSDMTGVTVGAHVVLLTVPRLQIARPGYTTPTS